MRRHAREALASYGEPVIGTLASFLENPREDIKTRMAIPGVLAMIDSPKSVEILLRNLEQRHVRLLHEIIRALNRLRMKYSSLTFDRSLVRNAILRKVKLFYRLVLVRSVLNEALAAGSDGGAAEEPARRLLMKVIEEKLGFTIGEIFRLLGLRYNPRDIYNAYLGVTSRRPALHANAVEFLDNVLEPGLKHVIIPSIERSFDEIVRNELYGRLELSRPSFDESIRYLLNGDDGWLKSCALFLIAETGQRQFLDTVSDLVRDDEVIVKETARYCTGTLSPPS
jgi:AAA family ATP:ADP antiporter